MKTKMFVIVALSAALTIVRFASAAEEQGHMEGEAKIPATVGGIWAEVKEHEEELGKIIEVKKLDKVHEAAFEIRDLVNALPDKSEDLPADNLAKVKSNARYVADIANRLDESGDAGDQAATETNFKKLQDFLKTIEAQYPDDLNSPYSEPGEQEVYYCPMHPAYTSDRPGTCPTCNMNLVKKEITP